MWLNRKSVEEITGLNSGAVQIIMCEYGIKKGRTPLINNMVLHELIADGYIERLRADKWDVLLDKLEQLQTRVYNLNLYMSYIEDYYPELFDEMMENHSGMPGYSRKEALNG